MIGGQGPTSKPILIYHFIANNQKPNYDELVLFYSIEGVN